MDTALEGNGTANFWSGEAHELVCGQGFDPPSRREPPCLEREFASLLWGIVRTGPHVSLEARAEFSCSRPRGSICVLARHGLHLSATLLEDGYASSLLHRQRLTRSQKASRRTLCSCARGGGCAPARRHASAISLDLQTRLQGCNGL